MCGITEPYLHFVRAFRSDDKINCIPCNVTVCVGSQLSWTRNQVWSSTGNTFPKRKRIAFTLYHGRRNRSGRPSGCRTNNLTNKNFHVHIVSTFVSVKWTKTPVEKCIHRGQLTLTKISKLNATRCQILTLECTKFDFRWASPQTPLGELTALPRSPRCIYHMHYAASVAICVRMLRCGLIIISTVRVPLHPRTYRGEHWNCRTGQWRTTSQGWTLQDWTMTDECVGS